MNLSTSFRGVPSSVVMSPTVNIRPIFKVDKFYLPKKSFKTLDFTDDRTSTSVPYFAQSAGAVENTDCTSAEG